MSYILSPLQFMSTAPPVAADALRSLAQECEDASADQQGPLLVAALEVVLESSLQHFSAESGTDRRASVTNFVTAGAMESAVIGLMPLSATFTGARLANGAIIAQVVLGGGYGAHSRAANLLAMGWLAALLRAVAFLLEDSASSSPHFANDKPL